MKLYKTLLTTLAVGLITCGMFAQQASAQQINGNINFFGNVELDSTSAGSATMVTEYNGFGSFGDPFVSSSDGDFLAFAPPGSVAMFATPWSFTSGPLASFWAVGGFTFDLISSHIETQGFDSNGQGFVSVAGTGTISGNGFDPTLGSYSFTTQDPSSGSPAQFSFSSATAAAAAGVPDGGATVMLLGLAFAGVAAARRKLNS